MIVAVVAAVLSQQAAFTLPEEARADPFGYERAECSPLIRDRTETLEACQLRVRRTLSVALGDALPDALKLDADLGPRPIRSIPSARIVPEERRCEIIGSTAPDGRRTHHERCTDRAPAIPLLGNH
ncbi:MAG TPA: hypothetical protein VFF66_03690 [Brevundimonas sp.]|nr:hypothetical protein [Brevundimonas sp.]